MKLTVAKKMQGEEEITMDIMKDEIVNEESLYDKIVDRLDEEKKTRTHCFCFKQGSIN